MKHESTHIIEPKPEILDQEIFAAVNKTCGMISDLEHQMQSSLLCVAVNVDGLSWAPSVNGKFRIIHGDKPLVEHKLQVRMQLAPKLELLKLEAIRATREVLGLNNRIASSDSSELDEADVSSEPTTKEKPCLNSQEQSKQQLISPKVIRRAGKTHS